MKRIKIRIITFLVFHVITNCPFINAQCITNNETGFCSGGNGELTNGCTINSGNYYWYSGTGTVNNILINSGTLVVCGNLTIDQSLNWNGNFTIIVKPNASLTFTQSCVNIGYTSTIVNYGSLVFLHDLSMQGTPVQIFIKEDAAMSVKGCLTLNGTSQISNSGALSVQDLRIQTTVAPAICMLTNSNLTLKNLINNTQYSVSAPDGISCITYSGNAYLNNSFSNTSNLILCAQTGATTSGTGNFGSLTILSPCTSCGVALPIEIIYFNATAKDNHRVMLEWATASEKNNDYFTVERSLDGVNWEEAVKAPGAGNSTSILYYSAYDNNPYLEHSYYRLKQTDFDGTFEYFKTISVDFNETEFNNTTIYPNPTDNEFILTGSALEIKKISLFNSLGQDITSKTKIKRHSDSEAVINLSEVSPGLYYVKTATSSNIVYKQ